MFAKNILLLFDCFIVKIKTYLLVMKPFCYTWIEQKLSGAKRNQVLLQCVIFCSYIPAF